MITFPMISVVMSVYNGEKHVEKAVFSILSQTFSDFEFIIINDGSTDDTQKILESFKDDRITLINQENLGLTHALNRAIALTKGKFIARQDADDLSKPLRLEMQLAYMTEHPEVGLLGTRFEHIDENEVVVRRGLPPLENKALQDRLPLINQFCHTSVLIRREALDKVGAYREYFKYAQDYDLWLRISEQYEIANLEELLCSYRELGTAISSHKILLQSRYAAVAAEMAHQRRTSSIDDLMRGEEPAFPAAETFSTILQKKMSSFYAQNPDKLIANLKSSVDRDFPFFFERICQERLQYEEELQHKNAELRTSSDTICERDAQIGMISTELEQAKQQLHGMKAKGFDAVERNITTLIQEMHENREILTRLCTKMESELLQKDEQLAAAQAALTSHQKSAADEKTSFEAELSQRDQHLREKAELVSQLQEQLDQFAVALTIKDEQLQRLEATITETQLKTAEQIRTTDEKLEQANGKLQELEQLLLSKQTRIQELEIDILAKLQRLQETQHDLEQTRMTLESSQEAIAGLEREKETVNSRIEILLSEKAVLETDQQALLSQLSQREQVIEDLLHSASWKVTAPLRGIVDFVKHRQ